MMRSSIFTSSLVLCLLAACQASAQFRVYVAADYAKLVTSLVTSDKKYEGQAGIRIKALGFHADYGMVQREPSLYKNGEYLVKGSYYRAGADYYVKVNPQSVMGFGLRYAQSTFEDKATFTITSRLFDDYTQTIERKNLEASWAEFVLTNETRMNRFISMGFNLRLRRLNAFANNDPVPVYAIPGYGLANRRFTPALNLYVKFLLPGR